MATSDDNPEPRYYGVHEGYVVNNLDPSGLGRVRVCVPGLLPEEGSTWAYPMGVGLGQARGRWDIPDIRAEVYVWFLNGDPEKVRYMPGHHFLDGEPSAITAAKNEATTTQAKIEVPSQVKVIHETDEWQFVVDERPDNRRAYIQAKSLGENLSDGSALMIEFDREQGVLTLAGIGGIALRSLGLLDIQATAIQIGGRKVIQGIDKPI